MKLSEYAEEDVCPKCKSKNIEYSNPHMEIGYANWDAHCLDCGLDYEIDFRLIFTGVYLREFVDQDVFIPTKDKITGT